jgi:hypothetical protein
MTENIRAIARVVVRRALQAKLIGTARLSARGIPNATAEQDVQQFKRHLMHACAMLDHAVALCTIDREERQPLIDTWIRTEARFWLYNFSPADRRKKLLDPTPGPQRFLTLRTRREMLAEIDEAA